MQKITIKASILIWAIFLSLIISVTFISVSTKINKNLKNNSNLNSQIQINNEIDNIINSGSVNGFFINKILENGDEIIFDDDNIYIGSIKKGNTHLSKINISSDIEIILLKGSHVYYKNNFLSGIVSSSRTLSSTNTGFLEINSLGGYSKIKIISSNTGNFLSQYKTYKIIKKIGNKNIIKYVGKIKTF